MKTRRSFRFCFPVLTALLTMPVVAGNVYKWVDEEGITHYGEHAPTDQSFTEVKTYGDTPKNAEARKRLEQQRAEAKRNESAAQLQREQQKLADEQARVREENCQSAQENLKTLQENARVRVMGDDGKFRYLSETEHQEEIRKAREVINDNCDS